jgi:4-amino-4-deoxy-L-arabinose transferase-like glycosyltransferase
MRFEHPSKELFFGTAYDSFDLPWMFVPVLMGLQFTEPVVLLGVVGMGLALIRLFRRRGANAEHALLLAWFGVPIVAQIVFRSTLYNNFRQLLFITPPLFVLAGLGLQAVLERVGRRGWKGLVVAAVLVPGVISIWRLHPYEYVYYNSLVGGVRGAAGRFEMDYWCTSYRQAIEYVNSVAPRGATVAVHWSPHLVSPYARPDLRVTGVKSEAEAGAIRPDYVLVCAFADFHIRYFRDLRTLHEVTLEGAVLATVKAGRTPDG